MALTYDQLGAIVTNLIEKKLADGVFQSNALLARFSRPDKLKLRDGGVKLQYPVSNVDESDTTGAWFSGSEALDNTEYDAFTAAEYDWKNLHETVKIAKSDIHKATGDSAKLSLVAEKLKIAERAMKHRLGTAIHAGAGGNAFDGLSTILSTTASLGGIATADFAEWVAVVDENSGTDRALTLSLLQSVEGQVTEDSDRPTVRVSRQNVYDEFWALVQPHQRLVDTSKEMQELGFSNVPVFNGIPWIIDSNATAQQIQFLNEEYLFLVAHRNENMSVISHEHLEGSHAMQRRIFFMGALCCNNRRFQGSLQDVSVA